jgi:hypothetical protein
MPITVDKKYEVRDNPDVFLSMTVGEGQFGRSDIFLDSKKLIRTSGSIKDFLIGKGKDVRGKELLIRTLGVDVNAQSNRMAMTYKMKGGQSNLDFESTGKVANNGGTLLFETTIALV